MVEILYLTRRAVGALQSGYTALHYAAGEGHDSVVETLLKAEGCDVNAKDDVRIKQSVVVVCGGQRGSWWWKREQQRRQ